MIFRNELCKMDDHSCDLTTGQRGGGDWRKWVTRRVVRGRMDRELYKKGLVQI